METGLRDLFFDNEDSDNDLDSEEELPRPSRTLKFNVCTLFLMMLLSVRLKFEAYNCKMSGMTSKGVLEPLKTKV